MNIKILNKNELVENLKNVENPLSLVLLGHLTLLILALPYYGKFEPTVYYSVLVMFFNIVMFGIPYFVKISFNANDKNNNDNNDNNDNEAETANNSNLKDNSLKNHTISNLKDFKKPLVLLSLVICGIVAGNGIYAFLGIETAILFIIIGFGLLELFFGYYKKYSFACNKEYVINNKKGEKNKNKRNIDKIGYYAGLFGILSFIIIVLKYGNIPILDYSIRMGIANEPLRLLSYGTLSYFALSGFLPFIIALGLNIGLGYKAGVLTVVVSYLIWKKKTSKISFAKLVFWALVLLVFLGVMSKLIISTSGQNWSLNFIEMLSYRAYFDIMSFDKVIHYPQMLMGSTTFIPNGEQVISQLIYGYNHNITTTMFAPFHLDFGLLGGGFLAFLFGLISKKIYENIDLKLYCIYGAILLSMTEIGFNYGFLVVVALFSYMAVRMQDYKIKYIKHAKNIR
ncbi:oligosaccharide repeat unit polymerase [Methanococcus voltae]|uniref:oligosaccharide repeat unit polymerase n=1 Tax=Methanococcus voltae TaxID=2188 RepID=UPI001AE0EB99|nr:oligosaccharide repeat unit polymerase [Methanococcus voltae]MBP2172624.1 putative membrane protein/F0F1-type ATP synthase assembly protein I [Methanococcus voltae]